MASDPKTVRDYLLLALDPSEGFTPNFEQFRQTMSADWFNNHIPHGRKTALRFLPLRELVSEFVPEMLDLYPVETLDQIDAILARFRRRDNFSYLWLANPSWISTAERLIQAIDRQTDRTLPDEMFLARLNIYFFINPMATSVLLDLSTNEDLRSINFDFTSWFKSMQRAEFFLQLKKIDFRRGSFAVPSDWHLRTLAWAEQLMRDAGKTQQADLTAKLAQALPPTPYDGKKSSLPTRESFEASFTALPHRFNTYDALAGQLYDLAVQLGHPDGSKVNFRQVLTALVSIEWFRDDSYLESLVRWQSMTRALAEALELPPPTSFLDPVL